MNMFGDSFCTESRTGLLFRRYVSDGLKWDVGVDIPKEAPPEGGFPMLVIMDAALHFDAAVAGARALARRPLKTGVGPTIVLGIASGADWGHDGVRRERELVQDGADHAVLHDLVEAVATDVATRAPINGARRTIMGHSFGGLFALGALGRATGLFDSCIAISPSFWRVPDFARTVARAIAGSERRILLASGSEEPRINADMSAAADILAGSAEVRHVVLQGEDHGSAPFAVLPMALRFLHGDVRQTV